MSASSAADEAGPVEFALCVAERAFGLLPRPGHRESLLLEGPEQCPQFRGRSELFDLGAGVVEWSGRERLLVDGESLIRGFFECLGEPGDWVAVVEVVEVAFSFARGGGDVEASLLAGAGEGDVAPFLQPLSAGAEDEGAIDGDSLAGVAGESVGVADVAVFDVLAR